MRCSNPACNRMIEFWNDAIPEFNECWVHAISRSYSI
ncbi:hypothetical protein [Ralstonia phage RSF1]|uniref:Uncharacterized protein n=1 Tax=Ralstonia phage RSF1 TaxID=1689679 RepID=A0A146I5R7_9CAUD|nr:hypothetical protein AVU11_agp28 [Ralstonia phage RSF1]BAU71419.1 hypothetical protein [Ralstonia phage RSF1]